MAMIKNKTPNKVLWEGCVKVVPSRGVYWIIWVGSWTIPIPEFIQEHCHQQFRVELKHQYLQMTHEAIDADR